MTSEHETPLLHAWWSEQATRRLWLQLRSMHAKTISANNTIDNPSTADVEASIVQWNADVVTVNDFLLSVCLVGQPGLG